MNNFPSRILAKFTQDKFTSKYIHPRLLLKEVDNLVVWSKPDAVDSGDVDQEVEYRIVLDVKAVFEENQASLGCVLHRVTSFDTCNVDRWHSFKSRVLTDSDRSQALSPSTYSFQSPFTWLVLFFHCYCFAWSQDV